MDAAAARVPRPRPPVGVRAVAGVHFVLGSAAAVFALFAMARKPADFQFLGLERCAVSDAEVMSLRAAAALLLLSGVAQAVAAALSQVAMAMAPALRLGRFVAIVATLLGGLTAYHLFFVVPMVITAVTVGQCADYNYLDALTLHYVLLDVLLVLLLLVGFISALASLVVDDV